MSVSPPRTPIAGGVLRDVLDTAVGASHRDDPVRGRTGGPAGNAMLTAWVGLLLLIFFVAECVTLLSLHSLITVHIVLGAFVVPLVLLKTATTGWRIARYYLGSTDYRQAGPPPLLLRVLGPLVVLSGLAVLGSGLALVALDDATFGPLFGVGGFSVNALTLHKVTFVLWLAATGAHVLVRALPSLQLVTGRRPHGQRLPGASGRAATLILVAAAGVVAALVTLHFSHYWTGAPFHTRFTFHD